MSQFDIHRNRDKRSRSDTPLLLDMQPESMPSLATRLVVPVRRADAFQGMVLQRLHPEIRVKGEAYVAFVTEMAAVPRTILGPVAESAQDHRAEIIAAIDLLITGF